MISNTCAGKAVPQEAEDMFTSYYRCYFDKYFDLAPNSSNPDR